MMNGMALWMKCALRIIENNEFIAFNPSSRKPCES